MTAQQPEHCETCEYKSMTGRDGSIQDCAVCDHTPTSNEKGWVKKMGCGKHSTRPHTPAPELKFHQPGSKVEYTVEQVAEIDKRIRQAARDATLADVQTDNIIAFLKKRYKNDKAILDYVDMMECEIMALRQQAGEP